MPTPLRTTGAGPGAVIDYIFVNRLIEVHDAWVSFDRLDPQDTRLCASDHFGLAARVSLADH